jgi:hypothetical protein
MTFVNDLSYFKFTFAELYDSEQARAQILQGGIGHLP